MDVIVLRDQKSVQTENARRFEGSASQNVRTFRLQALTIGYKELANF